MKIFTLQISLIHWNRTKTIHWIHVLALPNNQLQTLSLWYFRWEDRLKIRPHRKHVLVFLFSFIPKCFIWKWRLRCLRVLYFLPHIATLHLNCGGSPSSFSFFFCFLRANNSCRCDSRRPPSGIHPALLTLCWYPRLFSSCYYMIVLSFVSVR